jgi:hypothetical protein
MRFQDIPQFTRGATYVVDVPWAVLDDSLGYYLGKYGLDLDPDFQRGYVWTPLQQTRYVEFILRGGATGRDLYTNCPGWNRGHTKNFVMVDGKQRLTAARAFLDNKVPVFDGLLFRDFTDGLSMTGPGFKWHVNDLQTRAEVLQWYVDLNTGGTLHTDEEIDRVKALIEAEKR